MLRCSRSPKTNPNSSRSRSGIKRAVSARYHFGARNFVASLEKICSAILRAAGLRASGAPGYCAVGARLLFLPPCSPDLNPIEQVFAKLKTLRKAAERTVEAAWQRIGALLNCFTPQDCANYIRNAGYAAT
jgi:hypothetical protein